MDLNADEIACGINLSEDWSTRHVLATASIQPSWDFDREPFSKSLAGQMEADRSQDKDGDATSSHLPHFAGVSVAAEMCSDTDNDGPLIFEGPRPAVDGDSEDEGPVHFGDARHRSLATASDSDGVEIFEATVLEDDVAGQGAAVGAGSWEPGWNAGTWITSARTPDEQSQVLICNAYLVAKRLPKNLLQALAQFFDRKKNESRPLRVAAGFLGMTRRLLYETVKNVRDRLWAPAVQSLSRGSGSRAAEVAKSRAEDANQVDVLTVLVRAALSTGDTGYRSFTTSLARLSLAGVDVGDRYHSPQFAKEVIFWRRVTFRLWTLQVCERPSLGLVFGAVWHFCWMAFQLPE